MLGAKRRRKMMAELAWYEGLRSWVDAIASADPGSETDRFARIMLRHHLGDLDCEQAAELLTSGGE